ncbi:antigen 43 domain protein [Escherichia coli DEC12B]|nr:antigen 43 domain protein [Escherichia coli DEC12B]
MDAQNGATTEEGAFALSRPLQAGAFNYTLNRDSDEDWYLRSEMLIVQKSPVCLHADTGNGL